MERENDFFELYNDDDYDFDRMEIIELDDSYENVYDQDGDYVYCDYCGDEIKMKEGEYVCPGCGQVMDLQTFLNYIGFDPDLEY